MHLCTLSSLSSSLVQLLNSWIPSESLRTTAAWWNLAPWLFVCQLSKSTHLLKSHVDYSIVPLSSYCWLSVSVVYLPSIMSYICFSFSNFYFVLHISISYANSLLLIFLLLVFCDVFCLRLCPPNFSPLSIFSTYHRSKDFEANLSSLIRLQQDPRIKKPEWGCKSLIDQNYYSPTHCTECVNILVRGQREPWR